MEQATVVPSGGLAEMDRSELEAFIRELILQREAERATRTC